MGCCPQGVPLDVEFPCPGWPQTGCYLGVEYRQVLLEQLQGSPVQQEQHRQEPLVQTVQQVLEPKPQVLPVPLQPEPQVQLGQAQAPPSLPLALVLHLGKPHAVS
jgi:hypothetical protein